MAEGMMRNTCPHCGEPVGDCFCKPPDEVDPSIEHVDGCSGRLKLRWSGRSCDCGRAWVCL